MPVSNRPVVFGGKAPAPDKAAAEAFVRKVTALLNTHLTDLVAGGKGRLGHVAAAGLLDSAPTHVITGALASPDRPVTSARYEFLVAVDPAPRWLRVTVTTVAPDGRPANAQLIFVPGPVLIGAGPGPARPGPARPGPARPGAGG